MPISFPNDPILNAMERYMDLSARKQDLVVSNLANIDTPGYRAFDLSVELAMQEATPQAPGIVLRRQTARHQPGVPVLGGSAQAFAVEGVPQRNDGNNVDLDREMLNLSRTALKFALISQIMRSEFHMLHHAISEGK